MTADRNRLRTATLGSSMNDAPQPANPPIPNQDLEPPNTIVFILLALFLGELGIHRFYIGDKKRGITLLLLTFPGIFLIIPFVIAIIWSIVDACRVRQIMAEWARGDYS